MGTDMISSVGHVTSPSSCLDIGTSVQPDCMERISCGVSMEGWEAGRLECGRKGLGSSHCSLHSAHLQFGLFSQVLIFSLDAECFLTHGELCQCLAPSSALGRSSTACNLGGMCTLSAIAEAPPVMLLVLVLEIRSFHKKAGSCPMRGYRSA